MTVSSSTCHKRVHLNVFTLFSIGIERLYSLGTGEGDVVITEVLNDTFIFYQGNRVFEARS